jgi:glutathione S-transferase
VTAILWQVEVSHYNEKARWALDYKALPHVRRAPLPGFHGLYARAITRGAHHRLPILELDGRRVGDSTAIIAALEEHRPEPPLYPADPAERERALALEDFLDEELAPRLRRYFWHHTLPDRDAVVDAVFPSGGGGRVRLLRLMGPVAGPALRRDYGISEASAAEALTGIRAAMDRVEREVGPGGYLVGDAFTVADLAAAALFTPVLAPPGRPYAPRRMAPALLELREELAAREGGEWVARIYARHRGESAEIAASGA